MSLVRRIYRSLHVDSLPSDYYSSEDGGEVALVAGGCFWGIEAAFRREFGDSGGLLDVRCVYAGDKAHRHPVDTNLESHAESVLVKFKPAVISYDALLLHFFRSHDPTQRNGQGNDIGKRYRSSIWTFSDAQVRVAKEVRTRISLHYKTKVDGQVCATKILPADVDAIWVAERRHQRYLEKHPDGYHCHTHYTRRHIQ